MSAGKLAGPHAGRAGIDGESLESFGKALETNLSRLSSDLRSRRFVFGDLQPFFIPKKGGRRLICVPAVKDRVVQRAILDYLTPKSGWLSNGVSHGFVPDLGVPDAVKLAVHYREQKPWVFKTDITAFFDRIDRALLTARVSGQVRHRSLHPLLQSALGCEIRAETKSVRSNLKTLDIRRSRGVRQGMPLSPFFANLMLSPFDRACQRNGLMAVRYADDLIFFASSEEEAIGLQGFCLAQLGSLNLEIPELSSTSKTKIYAPSEAAEFLGVELRPSNESRYEVAVPQSVMDDIRTRILSYGSLDELKARNLDVAKFGNALRAAVSAYAATYAFCSNGQDLQNNLDAWEQSASLRVAKALGIKVGALSDTQRWFLRLPPST